MSILIAPFYNDECVGPWQKTEWNTWVDFEPNKIHNIKMNFIGIKSHEDDDVKMVVMTPNLQLTEGSFLRTIVYNFTHLQ